MKDLYIIQAFDPIRESSPRPEAQTVAYATTAPPGQLIMIYMAFSGIVEE